MAGKFMQAAGYGQLVNGLKASLPDGVQQAAGGALAGLGSTIASALQKLTGQSIDPALIEKVVAQVTSEQTAPAKGNGHGGEATGSTSSSEMVNRLPAEKREKKA